MKYLITCYLICLCIIGNSDAPPIPSWGFYGHRLINRMAVFTLPSSMIGLYKFNIDFLSDHAVDPDKRRYASRHEAVRHYIDLDHWGEPPFDNVPRRWIEMLAGYLRLSCINASGDTTLLQAPLISTTQDKIPAGAKDFTARHLLPQYYEEDWRFDRDTVQKYFPEVDCKDCKEIIGSEEFTRHGILPYHLYFMQQRLTDAFAQKDLSAVLRLSADFGHYLADAHVPLHTTENYNGQLTGQDGIHAFWESRIPELFAERDWDFLVGQATYIDDPVDYYWNVVLKSHRLADEVLHSEKELSQTFPADQQYCFEERLSVVVRTQCADYAEAYHLKMEGMVETRMQDAIQSVGSAWFTAWVDGGQPQFHDFLIEMNEADRQSFEALEREFVKGKAFGREHE